MTYYNSTAGPFKKQHGKNSDFTDTLMKADKDNMLIIGQPKKHMSHREETIHSEASRAFLTDPAWPRTNHAPNISMYSDREVTPVMKVKKMHQALLDA